MSRERFLKELQYFDENFNAIVHKDKEWDKMLKSQKRLYDKERSSRHSQSHNRIEIPRVRHLTTVDNNCFKPLYNLDNDLLFAFFSELSKIELALNYFDDFAENYKDLIKKNKNQSKQKKINEVMEMLSEDSVNYETTIKDLRGLYKSLNNNHFTKRQIFEHLLFWVALVLNKLKQGRNVASVTNKLIKDYFSEEYINFSRETKINVFKFHTYYYTDAKGINLYHS